MAIKDLFQRQSRKVNKLQFADRFMMGLVAAKLLEGNISAHEFARIMRDTFPKLEETHGKESAAQIISGFRKYGSEINELLANENLRIVQK